MRTSQSKLAGQRTIAIDVFAHCRYRPAHGYMQEHRSGLLLAGPTKSPDLLADWRMQGACGEMPGSLPSYSETRAVRLCLTASAAFENEAPHLRRSLWS
jgi:hypothetical protein